jgi:hypothetical protein
MLGVVEGLLIAAIAAAITWFFLRKIPAKPRNPKYGLMVNRWERTTVQVAYDADLNVTASCIHLQPVERAIRKARIDVHLFDPPRYGPIIRAECHINEAALRRDFSLPASIVYREEYRPEVSDREEPHANLCCRECPDPDSPQCNILVVHPIDKFPERPWFPSPP